MRVQNGGEGFPSEKKKPVVEAFPFLTFPLQVRRDTREMSDMAVPGTTAAAARPVSL